MLRGACHFTRFALSFALTGQLKGKTGNELRPCLGNDFERKLAGSHVCNGLTCSPTVEFDRSKQFQLAACTNGEVFKIFAQDDEINALRVCQGTFTARNPACGPHIGIGVFAPSQMPNDWCCRAAGSAKKRGVRCVDSLARVVGK